MSRLVLLEPTLSTPTVTYYVRGRPHFALGTENKHRGYRKGGGLSKTH